MNTEASETEIETVQEPPKSEQPRTPFSDALKAAEAKAGHSVELNEKVEVEKEKPDTSHIPEELLTKVDPPKDEIKTALDYELPAGASKASQGHFAKLKEHAKHVEADRDTLKAEVERLRKTPVADHSEALKAERQRIADLEEKLERAAFTESPKFKAYEQRETDTVSDAKAHLEGTEIDPSIIDSVARLPKSKRGQAMEDAGLSATQISTIAPYFASLDNISREKASALANHKSTVEQWTAQERSQAAQEDQQRQAQEDRLFEDSAKVAGETMEEYRRVPGQEAWNQQIDALEARSKEIYSGGIPKEELPNIARKAAAYEVVHKMNAALKQRLAEAQAQVKKMTAVQPGAGDARRVETANGRPMSWSDHHARQRPAA